jgi:nucleotide-binding universal stress UspA family protein
MYKILLATDGSEHSQKTIQEVIKLAQSLEAEITVLSVVESIPIGDYNYYYGIDNTSNFVKSLENAERNLEDRALKILEKSQRDFQEKDIIVETLLRKGQPADIICKVAEEGGFDLVVVGSRGLGGLKELILGSVSNKVAHSLKVSLLIVK